MWNGNEFNLESIQVVAPQYRYQAVQDADYATLDGDYTRAMDLYQQVIFSDYLDWWSKEKALQRSESNSLLIQGLITPTPLPVDTTERSILSAYAYFRIILLNILEGNQAEAENTYNTLVEQYEVGKPGYAFVEMASSFWNEYLSSHDIHQACSKAVEYAEENQASTIQYLGSDYHGWQSHAYSPEDVCPFVK